MKFIDEVKLKVVSGDGGSGCQSFRKESHVPRGGPDGGDGGKGGDVILKTNPRLASLVDLRFRNTCKAQDGLPGGGSMCSGLDGENAVLELPVGTLVKDLDGKIIVDLEQEESEYVLLHGGRGGKGNSFFKTSINQAPTHFQVGEEGHSLEVVIELKLLADIGIIGFPNVGKSTLISSMSAAKPKVANYEFTTLVPNLGVVKYGDQLSYVVADIPGLVKDAHKGVGLGIKFLKHIERTKAFVHVIDVSSANYRDPLEDYYDIRRELELYDTQLDHDREYFAPLADRDEIVVLNKIDSISAEELVEVKNQFKEKGIETMEISAVTQQNVKELKYKIGDLLFKEEEEVFW